jgi:hypothetical protein
MLYRALADAVVLLHLGIVLFIVLGGLLAWRWPAAAFVHVPFAAWGCAVELAGWICPLTPLENTLRHLGDEAGYRGGFVDHYVLPVLYPDGLGRNGALWLAGLVLAVNLAVYVPVLRRWRRQRPCPDDA